MNWIDIACVALMLLIAFFGFIRGFFSVLIHFAAYVASFIGANVAAKLLSPILYERFLQSRVLLNLRVALPNGSVSGGIEELVQKSTASLPEPLGRMVSYFDLAKMIGDSAPAARMTVDEIEQTVLSPILIKMLSILAFVVCFIVLCVILRLIAGAIDSAVMKRKGVIPTVNKVLGGVFGLIKSVIPVGVLCALLNVIAPVINVPSFTELVGDSFFCGTVLKLLS